MAAQPVRATWQHDLAAALVLLAMGALLLWRSGDIGPTVDEPFHVVRGLSWWWTGTGKLSYAHPPLANVLMTAPAAALFEPIDFTAAPGWDTADHGRIAGWAFTRHYDQLRPMMMVARLGSVVLGVVLAGAVYLWTSRRLGAWIGLAAVVLVAFNPTILAHAQLVTTDLPVALTVFLSVAAFIDYLKPRPGVPATVWRRWLTLAAFGAAVGAALITKFTALTFVPFFGVVGLVWAWFGWGRFTAGTRGRRLLGLAGDIGVVALISVFMVCAIYRFEDVFWTVDAIRAAPEPQCYLTQSSNGAFLETYGAVGRLPGWLIMPVPYTWLFGLEMVRTQGHMLHDTWFMGRASDWGHPAYFPVLFVLKTPVVVHLGLLLAAGRFVFTRRAPSAEGGLLLGAALLLLGLLTTSTLNIGFRHALPIVPLLTVLSAWALAATARDVARMGASPRRVRIVQAAVVLLLATPVWATVSNAGHYLAYFNVGRQLGERVSIVGEDWGQDTIRLARVVQERDLQPLRYMPFGFASLPELKHQGLTEVRRQRCSHRPMGIGWLAIHAANAKRYPNCFKQLEGEPDLIVADHIYLYELTPPKLREGVRKKRAKARAEQQPDAEAR